ncbi:capsule polysaccharide biosynthesis protein [Xylariaceae sp. FL0804]|nr:capsule polysaccharide biosynthesis protein [Xylariaceae sp. FL0804]
MVRLHLNVVSTLSGSPRFPCALLLLRSSSFLAAERNRLPNLPTPRPVKTTALGSHCFSPFLTAYALVLVSSMASHRNPVAVYAWLTLLGLLVACMYAMHRLSFLQSIVTFCTGPGSYSRVFAAVVLAINWKSLPFAWNVRIWSCMILHLFIRDFHAHTPDKLFHPIISVSHASIGEIDYRLHKSNSTYLADLDTARSHLVSHLVARAGHMAVQNAKTRLVMDPANPSRPARGGFSIGIGGVHCSFKREIKPYQKYEMWSRVLTWDRKWLYIITHFVKKGTVRPRSWDAESCGPTRASAGESKDWEKHILATAVTTYVFKLGRLTIHPAVMFGASGLLPDRPGGWTSDEVGAKGPAPSESASLDARRRDDVDPAGWTWERTEAERQRGLVYARHFAALDNLHGYFDGGEDGALGQFSLG